MAQIAGGSSDGGGQEEAPVEPEQHAHRARQEGHVAEPGERRVREHALDFAHVVVDPRHDLAERGAREEARREAVQVPVDGHAHVEENLGRDLRVTHPADEVQDEAGRGDQGEEDDDPHQGVRVLAEEGVVDEGAREEGDVEGEGGAGEVESQDDREAALVGKDACEAAPDFLVENGHSVCRRHRRLWIDSVSP